MAMVPTPLPRGGGGLWFERDGNRLRFSQVTTRQKYRNLQRDTRMVVTVEPEHATYFG